MRHLADTNQGSSPAIVYVSMREKFDCLTCATAMLLGLKYEDVVAAFGGNIDPSKGKEEECLRMYNAFRALIEKYHRGILELIALPPIVGGRRYLIGVHIDDPAQPLSKEMGHSIVLDEAGRVFDPNPQYGQFKCLADWQAAMTLAHELTYATEIFEFSL
jgi:hypothetical protein